MRTPFDAEASLILKMYLAHGFMSRCSHGDQRSVGAAAAGF